MLLTNHVLAGALIGTLCPKPSTAFMLGVASHFAMDAVPHWGLGTPDHDKFIKVAVADGLLGLGILALVARRAGRRRPSVIAGVLGACAPDANKPTREWFGRSWVPGPIDRFHSHIQTEDPQRMLQEVFLASAQAMVLARLGTRLRGGSDGPCEKPEEEMHETEPEARCCGSSTCGGSASERS